MSRIYQDWPTQKNPDGRIFNAIHDLDVDKAQAALEAGADINCRIRGIDAEAQTPLSEMLSMLPYSEAVQGSSSLSFAMRLGQVSAADYQRHQQTMLLLMAENGADLLARNEKLMLPVDAGLRYVKDCDNAPTLARAALLTELALQTRQQSYRPDLPAIFMQMGDFTNSPASQRERQSCMTAIAEVAKLVVEELHRPRDPVSEKLARTTSSATRAFWSRLAEAPPAPDTLPHPSAAFVALSERADESINAIFRLHVKQGAEDTIRTAWQTRTANVSALHQRFRHDLLAHQCKMDLG